LAHPLDDEYHKQRSAVWSKITTPLLTAANWGGQGLHPRGNFEGFMRAASSQKWLEAHGLEHWTEFYTDYGIALQKRFFGHFLKGEDNGWLDQPPVQLQVRKINGFEQRTEDNWPIPRTQWTQFYLDSDNTSLSLRPPVKRSTMTFSATGEGITFMSAPLDNDTEITGPSAIKFVISSSTPDADLFVILRVFSPKGDEVVFQGAIDPHTPIGQGWLRASHRKLDQNLSKPWRPYHAHDENQPLSPGEKVHLDIEIWPTSIVVPAGFQIGVTVRGRDYEYPHASGQRQSNFKNELRGCGPFLHDDPRDRPSEVFNGETSIHIDPEQAPYLLLPIIP
jgi:predicted acyl esterase